MTNLSVYLSESALCLLVCYTFYFLFLKSDKLLLVRRYFLLFTCVVSVLLPIINVNPVPELYPSPLSQISQLPEGPSSGLPENSEEFSFTSMLLLIYFSGVFLMTIRLFISLWRINQIIIKGSKYKKDKIILVATSYPILISSFFNYIFYSPNDYSKDEFDMIITHEKKHSADFHSVDLLLSELLVIMQWFNPFSYLIRSSLKEVHEYLCDQYVLQQRTAKDYEKLIIRNALKRANLPLASSFNEVSIKKRIAMINKKKPSRLNLLKLTLIIPMVLGLFWACNNEFAIQDPLRTVTGVVKAEDGTPLPGVNVLVKGSTLGTVTDMKGQFSLKLTPDAQDLAFSFIGMETQVVPVGNKEEFDVVLPQIEEQATSQSTSPSTSQVAELKKMNVSQELIEDGGEYFVVGTVSDANDEPLPGMNIVLTGQQIGTVSDPEGRFRLKIPAPNGYITYSFVGYERKYLKIE